LSEIAYHAETAYLLLDALTCPYIARSRKKIWIDKFRMTFSLPAYTSKDVNDFLNQSAQNIWFINWHGVDILTLLQKKEVVQAY